MMRSEQKARAERSATAQMLRPAAENLQFREEHSSENPSRWRKSEGGVGLRWVATGRGGRTGGGGNSVAEAIADRGGNRMSPLGKHQANGWQKSQLGFSHQVLTV